MVTKTIDNGKAVHIVHMVFRKHVVKVGWSGRLDLDESPGKLGCKNWLEGWKEKVVIENCFLDWRPITITILQMALNLVMWWTMQKVIKDYIDSANMQGKLDRD